MSTSDFNVKVGVRNPSTKKKAGVLLKFLTNGSQIRANESSKTLKLYSVKTNVKSTQKMFFSFSMSRLYFFDVIG